MINIKESTAAFMDRMDGINRFKAYKIIFDWEDGNIILYGGDGDLIDARNQGRILLSGLTHEAYVSIEIHAKVKE